MKIIGEKKENQIDPGKTFNVELTLVELAAIAALTGKTNNTLLGGLVNCDYGYFLGDYITEFFVGSHLYEVTTKKLSEEGL